MKKIKNCRNTIKLGVISIALIIGGLIIIQSCSKKDDEIQPIKKRKVVSTARLAESDYYPEDDISDILTTFYDDVEEYIEENTDNISNRTLDEAVWEIEAALNYEHADITDELVNLNSETVSFEVTIDEIVGDVYHLDGIEIIESYIELEGVVSSLATGQIVKIFDIYVEVIDGDNVEFKCELVYGEEGEITEAVDEMPAPFPPNTNMKGVNLGNCYNPYPSTLIGAMREYERRYNGVIEPELGYHQNNVISNVKSLWYTNLAAYNQIHDFLWHGYTADECVGTTSLNYYLSRGWTAIQDQRPSSPYFLAFVDMSYLETIPPSFGNNSCSHILILRCCRNTSIPAPIL